MYEYIPMTRSASILILTIASASYPLIAQWTTAPRTGMTPLNLPADLDKTDDRYRQIAEYLAHGVLALRRNTRGFGSIRWSKHVYVKDHPFKPVVYYNHGVTKWELDRDSEPVMNRPVYAKSGFSVSIWMVKGDPPWQPKRTPVKVSGYSIDAQVFGPQRDRIQPLIDNIVAKTADHFNR
jgi:hypothetical protein